MRGKRKKKPLNQFHSKIYKADDNDVQAMNKMQESDTKYTKIVKQNISDSHFLNNDITYHMTSGIKLQQTCINI